MSIEFLKELDIKFKLKVIDCFKANDYGPLSFISVDVKNTFESSSYAIVRTCVLTNIFKLRGYQRNCYCLIENSAIKETFLKEDVIRPFSVRVPVGFRFFCGEMNRKKSSKLNVVIVYVPDEYLRDLIESCDGKVYDDKLLKKALVNQGSFFQKYIDKTNQLNKEYLEKHLSLSQTLKCLNNLNNSNLPVVLKNALLSLRTWSFFALPKCIKISNKLPETTFKLDDKTLRLPDGRYMTFKLELNVRYDGLHQNKAKRRFSVTSQTLHKYTVVFNWI